MAAWSRLIAEFQLAEVFGSLSQTNFNPAPVARGDRAGLRRGDLPALPDSQHAEAAVDLLEIVRAFQQTKGAIQNGRASREWIPAAHLPRVFAAYRSRG
jgi:hypothetical protein